MSVSGFWRLFWISIDFVHLPRGSVRSIIAICFPMVEIG